MSRIPAFVQDWKPVIFKKKSIKSKKNITISDEAIRLNNVDNKTIEDNLSIKTIDQLDKNEIIKLRLESKLSQEILANNLNLGKDIIKNIENGSYPLNKKLFNQIKNYLKKYNSTIIKKI